MHRCDATLALAPIFGINRSSPYLSLTHRAKRVYRCAPSCCNTETDDFSVNTEDAADVIARFSFIVASLEKAGVPPEELHHFKQVVSRLPLANNAGNAGNALSNDAAGQHPGVVAEGVLEKLQGGTQGFAPVWKSRWIRVLPGELQVFESAGRPEKLDSPCLICLPLSVQQTRIEPGEA